ncbi:hypothetical protein HOK51_08265 [Candidatus Woesearchaeota archaeon]|nr:hypothetical protein [Candidatus Woesearchaeota archaeon]MBT6519819.1 hypothetical protein [Candidatus Woesearchaeota archaeon]MBT7368198.1 hypothetical protein [Candidatus Woesearchaeota archaeon]
MLKNDLTNIVDIIKNGEKEYLSNYAGHSNQECATGLAKHINKKLSIMYIKKGFCYAAAATGLYFFSNSFEESAHFLRFVSNVGMWLMGINAFLNLTLPIHYKINEEKYVEFCRPTASKHLTDKLYGREKSVSDV